MSIQEILEKNGAQRDNYYESGENPQNQAKEYINSVLDSYDGDGLPPSYQFDVSEYRYLKSKWKKKIKEDCIGFSLALPCPILFYIILDEFLNKVTVECPDFLITNVFIKDGGIIIKLENISDEIRADIEILEQELFDRRLLK